MRKVKKIFYSNTERVKRLTSEAFGIMEPGTEMTVWVHRNGRTCLKTNSPSVLELFQTEIFNFDKKRDEND